MGEASAKFFGLELNLYNTNYTAEVIGLSEPKDSIFIPKSIKYKSDEYIITSINEKLIVNYKIKSIEFAIDSEITEINYLFAYTDIESIKFSSKVEKFSENWCSNTPLLVNITIPPSNKNFIYLNQTMIIGKTDSNSDNYDVIIFARRDIETITIPSFIKRISSSAFSYCKQLREIEFTENSELLSIGKDAFSFSIIKSFHIPSHVTDLEDNWCNFLERLEKVTVSPQNDRFKFLDKEKMIVAGKSKANSSNFDVLIIASRSINEVFVPDNITFIASSTFAYCYSLQKVSFSEHSNLRSIGESSFFRCRLLESIKVPQTVRTIGKSCFLETERLKTVEFGFNSELFSIQDYLFNGSGIEKVFIPKTVTSIGSFAFSNCNDLHDVVFAADSQLRRIGDSAFSYDKIEEIVIPRRVKQIEIFAFFKCSELKRVTFEGGSELEIMGPILFSDTSIESITIPRNVREIKERSFMNDPFLKSIEFEPDSQLTTICANAFVESAVESIAFPAKLEKLENNWCNFTSQLTNISISPENENFAFLDFDHKMIVAKSGKSSDGFDVIIFASRDIVKAFIPSFITKIDSSAFADCERLEKVEFQCNSKLNTLCEGSFSGCLLKTVVFPENVAEVETNTFLLCPRLENVEFLGESVLLGKDCFANCSALLLVAFPNAREVIFIYDTAHTFSFVPDCFSLFVQACAEIA